MKHAPPTLPLILALALLALPARADVSLFQGPSGGVGDVWIVREDGGGAPELAAGLQGIELLGIEAVGRTQLDRLDPGRARLRTDVPGGGRILLPSDVGSLYRYRRTHPDGSADYGLFLVDIDGRARQLWEIAGAGALGVDDPLHDRIAVAAAGDTILVATNVAAGGDLFEIELATGLVTERSASLAPLAVHTNGLCLFPSWGLALCDSGVLRFDRGAGAQALEVSFGAAPPVFIGEDVVGSEDGSTAAFSAGTDVTQAYVYSVRSTGLAQQVSRTLAHVGGAGFLPEQEDGPTLALSPDGSICIWATEGESRELWTRPVDAPASVVGIQLTGDAIFADTLNDSGVIAFLGNQLVNMLVGEGDPLSVSIEGADYYQVDLAATGAPAITNLTLTSADGAVPFLAKGELESDGGMARIPGTDTLLLHDSQSGGGGEVLAVDMATGVSRTILDDVKSLDFVELAGSHAVLSVRRDSTDERELYSLSTVPGSDPTIFATFPEDTIVDRPLGRDDGTFAAVVHVTGGEWLARIQLPGGAGDLLTPTPFLFGPTLTYATDGSLVASAIFGGSSYFGAWSPQGPLAVLSAGFVEGFLLPGS